MGHSPKVIQHAIVTYARSWSSLATIRSLGKRGVRVHASDSVNCGAGTFSKYVESSFTYPDPGDELKFINKLKLKTEEIHDKYGGEILLLPIHEETYVIAKHIKKFPKYVNIVLTDNNLLEKTYHKGKLIEIANKLNIDMPPGYYLKNKKQLENVEKDLIYPLFIKIPEGSGSVGIFKANDSLEMNKITKNIKFPIVIQSYVSGGDYCACALFDNGRPIAVITYTAIKTYPYRGGTTVYRKTVDIPEITNETIRILKKLKWHGVAEIDFRYDDRVKKAYLIEINPRFWGGLNHAIKANVDFPYLLWRIAEGHKIKRITKIDKNIRTRNFVGALASTIQELADLNPFKPTLKKFIRNPTFKNFKHVVKSIFELIPLYRKHLVTEFIKKQIHDDVYDPKDPGAMAGILFPLAVFAKYGKINEKLLISSSAKEKK